MHPVQKRIRSLGKTAKILVAIRGLGWLATVVIIATLLLALLDYGLYVAFRVDDLGLRVVFSILALAALVTGMVIYLRPAIRHRWTDVDVAQRIEQCFPELNDRLSSSIGFLDQEVDEPTAGSASLRRAVVADSEGFIDSLRVSNIIRFRPTVGIVVIALLLCTVTSSLLYALPIARRAAQRLVTPWADVQWPKRNQLAFEKPPARLAKGDDLELILVDEKDHMPDNVEFQFRKLGDSRRQSKAMKPSGDQMVVRLENVTETLEFRAVGGDHESKSHVVEVMEPPAITQLSVTLFPPAYTAWPQAQSNGHIRAIQGTRIEISGQVSKPVMQVELKLACAGETKALNVNVGEDQLSISVDAAKPWLVEQACEYWLELTDADGLVGGRKQRWRIQPVPDQPPIVSLDQPKSNSFVTSDAVIPIEAAVKDDIAIQSIELRYLLSSQSDRGEQTIELYRGSAKPPKTEPIGAGQGDREVTRTGTLQWKLASLGQLEPGQTIQLHINASDYRPQNGISPSRQLTVIAPEDLEDRIGQRQSFILSQLNEVLRVQREARSQTKSLEIRLDEAGVFEKRDIDQLQSAELNQRQIERLLFRENNGIESQIVSVLADLDINQIDSPDVRRRMTMLLDEIRRIQREHLDVVESELVNSLKISRSKLNEIQTSEVSETSEVFAEVKQPLATAGAQQDKVIESLEKLLGEYSEWDSFRRFARDIRRIHRQQGELATETDELRRKTIGKSTSELSSQERADVRILSQRQMELARRFDAVRSRMEQMQDKLAEPDPLIAKTLGDAVDTSLKQAIGGQMRESGRELENNRLGQSTKLQQDVAEGLQEVLDVLANRREQELERLVDKLKDAAADLEGLREQQEAVRKEIEQAGANNNATQRQRQLQRLTKQQHQLAEQAERLARRLQRLRADRAAKSAQQAGASMQKSGEASEQGSGESALENTKQAEQKLEEAQKQLRQAINQAETKLYQEKLAKLQQQIEGLAARQQNVIAETQRLDDLKKMNGNLSSGQQASLQELSRQQRRLADDTGMMAEKVESAEAFALALRGAVREMIRAARWLDQSDTGAETQRAEQVALVRLRQLVEALADDDDAEPPPEENPDGGGKQGDLPPAGVIQLLAQLKLVDLMQKEINRRTDELEEARMRRGGTLTEDQQHEAEDLAVEQGKLADIILNLSQPIDSNPEDDPDSLPDVRRESPLDDDLEKALEGALDPSLKENE